MEQADGKPSVWYRTYVLVVMLLVCICSLATRNQPSYLITIPVEECLGVCAGVSLAGPTCSAAKQNDDQNSTARGDRTAQCRDCLSQPLLWPSANPRIPPAHELPPYDKEAVWIEIQAAEAGRPGSRRAQSKLSLQEVERHGNTEVLPSSIAAYYNLSDGTCLWYWQYGLLIGYGFALVYAAIAIPAGFLCDRQSRVVLVTISAFGWSVATSMQALAHSFLVLVACRVIIGACQALGAPAAVSLVVDFFAACSERQRDAALALITMVGPALGAGCASFSIIFAGLMGWRWVVLITGVLGVLLAALVYGTVKEPTRTEWSAPCALSVVVEEVFEKSRVARMLMAAASAKLLAACSLGAFLPIWYARALLQGYSNAAYAYWNALAVSLGGLLAAALGSCLGQVWSRYDSRAPALMGLIGALGSIPLTFIIILENRFSASLSCYFVLLVLGEMWFAPSIALLQMAVRRSVRGQATSLLLSMAVLGGNLGPALCGFFDPGTAALGIHLLWITTTAQVAAAMCFWWIALEIGLDPVAVGVGTLAYQQDKHP